MADFFRFLVETNLITVAFIIGAIAFIIAVIGKFKTIIEPSPAMRVVLALFGLALMALSIGGYFLNSQATPRAEEISAQDPESVTSQQVTQQSSVQSTPMSILEPLREHYEVTVGEGLFEKGTFSDGMAPYSEQWLWDNDHFDVQRIRQEEYPSGCDISRYNTDLVWIGGTPGMSIAINGEEVGQYTIAADSHGYIFKWSIQMGDEICAVGFVKSVGFFIILGPDIYYQHDSYCYRGHCK